MFISTLPSGSILNRARHSQKYLTVGAFHADTLMCSGLILKKPTGSSRSAAKPTVCPSIRKRRFPGMPSGPISSFPGRAGSPKNVNQIPFLTGKDTFPEKIACQKSRDGSCHFFPKLRGRLQRDGPPGSDHFKSYGIDAEPFFLRCRESRRQNGPSRLICIDSVAIMRYSSCSRQNLPARSVSLAQ